MLLPVVDVAFILVISLNLISVTNVDAFCWKLLHYCCRILLESDIVCLTYVIVCRNPIFSSLRRILITGHSKYSCYGNSKSYVLYADVYDVCIMYTVFFWCIFYVQKFKEIFDPVSLFYMLFSPLAYTVMKSTYIVSNCAKSSIKRNFYKKEIVILCWEWHDHSWSLTNLVHI